MSSFLNFPSRREAPPVCPPSQPQLPRLPLHPRRRSVSPIASPIASRIAKGSFSDATYEAIGTVDELNSVIGFAAQMLTTSSSSSPTRWYDRSGNEPARIEAHENTEQEYKIEFRVDKWQRRVVTA